VAVFVFAAFCLKAQKPDISESNVEENDIILKYLDPNFPVKEITGDKRANEENYLSAMAAYAKSHPAFPMYINNGNPEEDQKTYDRACARWFSINKYFPQYIDTGKPNIDKENFEKAAREWKNFYQAEYKELYNAIYGDSELEEKYSFIIKN